MLYSTQGVMFMNNNKARLGFGLMRLPRVDGQIDVETVAAMANRFLEAGFTYFDTAYAYEGSEVAFRKAVVERHPRESFTIADKLPSWALSDTCGPKELFEESLRRCGVEYFDYYLLHNINGKSAPLFEQYEAWPFVNRMVAEGKIRHLGFSFHGTPELLEETLSAHPEVEFVQLQINYVDWEDEHVRAAENHAIVRAHGKNVTIMEPIKGGTLATLRPDAMEKLSALGSGATASSYALRYAGGLDGVRVVLSGMGTIEQMEENTKTFTDFRPLDEREQEAVRACRDAILSAPTVACTACRYCCEGCPMHIEIPEIIKCYNRILIFGDHPGVHFQYSALLEKGSGRAGDCLHCGQCEGVCPQHLEIIDVLAKASEILDKE